MQLGELKVMYDTVSARLAQAEADVVRHKKRKEELKAEIDQLIADQKAIMAEFE